MHSSTGRAAISSLQIEPRAHPADDGRVERLAMNAANSLRILWATCTLALCGCPTTEKSAPGYSGPLPSVVAQHALHSIEGQVLRGTKLSPGGQGLTVESYAVVPNPVTQVGPVVTLVLPGASSATVHSQLPQGAGGRWVLPIETDGDAADLVRRVTGAAPEGLGGATSAIYRKTLGLE